MKNNLDFFQVIRSNWINLKVNIKYKLQFQGGKYNDVIGNKYINKKLNKHEYDQLIEELYGNQYIENKYTKNEEYKLNNKRYLANLVHKYLNKKGDRLSICDAGANRGYLMKAFWELGYDAYGFDILEDKTQVVSSEGDIIRKNYMLGSILKIPCFNIKFDIVLCTNVFEHIPINYIDTMAEELLKLKPRYFVFEISADAISDGHITLKNSKFWLKKFKGYRLMKELTCELKRELTPAGEYYQYTGTPRNGWNRVPGIMFLEKEML